MKLRISSNMVVFMAGLALFSAGAALIYLPAALIGPGVILMAISVFGERSK